MRPCFKGVLRREIPGSFWGRNIPDLASTPQQMCNAIACAQANNMSMASGSYGLGARRPLGGWRADHGNLPVEAVATQERPHSGREPRHRLLPAERQHDNLMLLYEKWEMRADDATGVPRYTYGNGVCQRGRHAQGLSMLMNNAARGLRRAPSATWT